MLTMGIMYPVGAFLRKTSQARSYNSPWFNWEFKAFWIFEFIYLGSAQSYAQYCFTTSAMRFTPVDICSFYISRLLAVHHQLAFMNLYILLAWQKKIESEWSRGLPRAPSW